MNIPRDLKYTADHEWVKIDGKSALMGITDYAQHELGDVVYIELPEPGKKFRAGDSCAVIESSKAASDVYAPVTGTVADANSALDAQPELVNSSPYADGWLMKFTLESDTELADLMTAEEYETYLREEAGKG